MYLSTPLQWKYYLTCLLEQSWRPVLLYVAELYGSPICLDGSSELPLTSETPRKDIILQTTNFSYAEPVRYDYEQCQLYKIFARLIKKFKTAMASGFKTTLTAHIPKDRNHPFWQPDQQKDDFTWDVSPDSSISFQVTRWGPTDAYSRYYATHRAKDVIRNIRTAVINRVSFPSRVTLPSPKFPPISCVIFDLGIMLNGMWKDAKQLFLSPDFGQFAIDQIQRIIDSNEEVPIRQVLEYYQVHPLCKLTVDLFPHEGGKLLGCHCFTHQPTSSDREFAGEYAIWSNST
jgi:hypothetical protein